MQTAAVPASSSEASTQKLQQKQQQKQGSSSSLKPNSSRKMLTILGSDDRRPCPLAKGGPFNAIGELEFLIGGQAFICTGTLVRPDRVLTAAHCVYDMETRAFVSNLTFSPGRYRTANGDVIDPFGTFKWADTTIFQDFPNSQQSKSDIAVIKLEKPIGTQTGVLGLKGGCDGKPVIDLTTAGYPSDKDLGSCVTDQCSVQLSCNNDATEHTCDTYLGQSGSPFWDQNLLVRGVHVRGLTEYNEFTTINKIIVEKIASWS